MLYVGSLWALPLGASRAEDWFSPPLKRAEIPHMELAVFTDQCPKGEKL